MIYFICLFFPTFICLKQFISKDDKFINILIKYTGLNILINILGFSFVWLYSHSNSLIDNNIMTIPFFIKYLCITSIISLLIPKAYKYIKNNYSFEVNKEL